MRVRCLMSYLTRWYYKMVNATEEQEREYLEEIKEKLTLNLKRINERVQQVSNELKANKEYIYEFQSGMDEADWVAADQSLNRIASTGENIVATRKKIYKLMESPYFGRIDFSVKAIKPQPIYIGIASFTDELSRKGLIFDWRAPV